MPHYSTKGKLSVGREHPDSPEKRKLLPDFEGGLMDYEEALQLCLAAVPETTATEKVALADCFGRIVQERVECPLAVPPFDKSTMDGYAVKAVDVAGASASNPVHLKVVADVPAGRITEKVLRSGEAIKIMTGAAVPEGADAVIPLEQVTGVAGGNIAVYDSVGENPFIIHKGQDLLPGQRVAAVGTEIDAVLMGILASCGVAEVRVSRKPRVGIISTGSELVGPGHPLAGGRIYDVNGYLLSGLLQAAGAATGPPLRAGDKTEELLVVLDRSRDKDILLLSGGVSVGDYDIVQETLQKAGVTEIFWRVRVKPGKPLFFGRRDDSLIFGLPGNPVSSATNFFLFVRPVIDKILGKREWGLKTGYARLENSRILRPGRRKFLRGKHREGKGEPVVWIIPEQRSGVFSPMAETDVLIEVPETVKMLKEGEQVKVHYL